MNMNKMTQKSLEAIQLAQTLAVENSNQQIEQSHLLYALISQDGGVCAQLLIKMGIDIGSFGLAVKKSIDSFPKVGGSSREQGKVYVSSDFDKAIADAEKTATKMGDDYVSVEHLMLGLIQNPDSKVKEIFKTFSVTKDRY